MGSATPQYFLRLIMLVLLCSVYLIVAPEIYSIVLQTGCLCSIMLYPSSQCLLFPQMMFFFKKKNGSSVGHGYCISQKQARSQDFIGEWGGGSPKLF